MRYPFLIRIVSILVLSSITIACAHTPVIKEPTLNDLKDPTQTVQHFQFANGLELAVVERRTVPIVTILAAVKNGAMAESPEYDGLSHLYEHMFFKGNKEIPDQTAYMRRVRELGMSFNGTTSTEAVRYFFTLPSENLEEGLKFMYPALTAPLFSEEELSKETKTVLAEYDRNEASPMFHLQQAMTRALFPSTFSRKNVIGDREIIRTASREKMFAIQSRYYVPNNTMLIVVGDVDAKNVEALVRDIYLDWPEAEEPFDAHPVPPHTPLTMNKTLVVEYPFNNVLIEFAWHGPSVVANREDTYAADIFSFIVDQRASAFKKLLVDSGILQHASLSYYSQNHTGPIYFFGLAAPDRAAEALETMNYELSILTDPEYYTDEELETAKLRMAADSLYGWQEDQTIANELGFWWCVADLQYRLSYIDNLKRVTRADISAYLDKYITNKPYVLGALVAPGMKETVLPLLDKVAGKEVAQ